MKSFFKVLFTVLFFSFILSATAHAKQCEMPEDKSSAELNMIKKLAGKWVSVSDMFGKKNERLYTEYKVTAGGSAVIETIFPNTPYEMMSVYYDDNGKLAMTHYCMMRNRPFLKLVSSTEDSITMKVLKVAGKKSKKEPSMGNMTLTFKDKNHFISTCSGTSKGEASHTLEYTRVK